MRDRYDNAKFMAIIAGVVIALGASFIGVGAVRAGTDSLWSQGWFRAGLFVDSGGALLVLIAVGLAYIEHGKKITRRIFRATDWLLQFARARNPNIYVDWAVYTPHDEDNLLNGLDVASAVQVVLDRGATSLVADNTTLVGGDDNDPHLGTYKHLQIQWRIRGQVRSTRVPEGSKIDFVTGKVTAPS